MYFFGGLPITSNFQFFSVEAPIFASLSACSTD